MDDLATTDELRDVIRAQADEIRRLTGFQERVLMVLEAREREIVAMNKLIVQLMIRAKLAQASC